MATGTVPFDVQRLNVDFCTGGALKWLCGGPGTGYLYVRPDLMTKLEPTFTGWIGHENPFGFEIGATRYAPTIYRFTQGTPNIPALHVARPGLKIVAEIGVDKIRAKSIRQTALLVAMADQHGWRLNTPRDPERRGGTVSIDMPDAQQVCAELLKRDILVDYRPKSGVRFSPHFYNSDAELAHGIAAVEHILSEMKVGAQ
jgi:kynureninase